FEKTSRAATFQATPTPPHATPTLRTGPSSTVQLPPSTPACPPPLLLSGACRKLLENPAVLADFPTSVSPSSGHQISRTRVRPNRMRDLRRVQLARTSSRRSTKETTRAIFPAFAPPPKCRISLNALISS
ncbi:hypothetical protein Prudu_004782, partial [Prunus dulcis]